MRGTRDFRSLVGKVAAGSRESRAMRRSPRGSLVAVSSMLALSVACLLVDVPGLLAQGVIAYPAQGQSQDQQSRDRYECHMWAVQQTGFDPSQQQAMQSAPPPAGPQTGVLQGAGRGAAVGAVGGAIGGNAGKGAAIGAATGALIGGMRRNDQRRQQQANQQSGSSVPQQSNYNRALQTCLQGRGYTVN